MAPCCWWPTRLAGPDNCYCQHLLPTHPVVRSLELLQVLDKQWSDANTGLSVYPLVYLNTCAYSTLKGARTLTQFMSEEVQNEAQSTPFALHKVDTMHTLDELKGLQGLLLV